MGLLLSKTCDLLTPDRENAEVLNVFFASVFTSQTDLQEPQVPETAGKDWNKKDVFLEEEDQVRQYLSKLDIWR